MLSKQKSRSKTSTGANGEEAIAASSRADFSSKLTIAAKEARETAYWLRLLHDNNYLPTASFQSVYQNVNEIKRIIGTGLTQLFISAISRSVLFDVHCETPRFNTAKHCVKAISKVLRKSYGSIVISTKNAD